MNNTRRQFINALTENQAAFNIEINPPTMEKLADYYEFVQANNALLHLVAPSAPEVFATRHILESVYLTKFLPVNARFADIGAGAGLPSLPCLIFREDLRGALIESKLKKADFLQKVLTKCDLQNRAEVFNRQFEEVAKPDVSYVTCRALDKFTRKLPKIIKWAHGSNLLLFGGDELRDELKNQRVAFTEKLLPQSERRFIFIAV